MYGKINISHYIKTVFTICHAGDSIVNQEWDVAIIDIQKKTKLAMEHVLICNEMCKSAVELTWNKMYSDYNEEKKIIIDKVNDMMDALNTEIVSFNNMINTVSENPRYGDLKEHLHINYTRMRKDYEILGNIKEWFTSQEEGPPPYTNECIEAKYKRLVNLYKSGDVSLPSILRGKSNNPYLGIIIASCEK